MLQQIFNQVSTSRSGNFLDNAMKEIFFGTLKTERVDEPYPSRAASKVGSVACWGQAAVHNRRREKGRVTAFDFLANST